MTTLPNVPILPLTPPVLITTQHLRIKDLNPDLPLGGVLFRYPGDGQPYYWVSQWAKGVWGKKKMEDTRVYPLGVDSLEEALEWEVIDASGQGRNNNTL